MTAAVPWTKKLVCSENIWEEFSNIKTLVNQKDAMIKLLQEKEYCSQLTWNKEEEMNQFQLVGFPMLQRSAPRVKDVFKKRQYWFIRKEYGVVERT